MKKILKKILFVFLALFLLIVGYFSIGWPPRAEKIVWGVNFSQKHAELLGLDWRAAFLSLMNDLGAKDLKIATYWDLLEKEKNQYDFQDLDWQITQAEKKGAKILLVIGMKTPHWPECHVPGWAEDLNRQEQQAIILELVEKIVSRYSYSKAIWAWQAENESFLLFGECPWADKEFLKKEIALIKASDTEKRPVVVSDSGEFSFWITAARLGDIVGATLYRRAWSKELGMYVTHYWFRPIYYWRREQLIKTVFGKKVIGVELQLEPWCDISLYDCALQEQEKTMSLEKFRQNIEFAQKTGLDTFYLWGAEWWYWLKEKQNQPAIWNEAKKLW